MFKKDEFFFFFYIYIYMSGDFGFG